MSIFNIDKLDVEGISMRVEGIKTTEIQFNSQRLSTGDSIQRDLPRATESDANEAVPQKKYSEEDVKIAIGNANKTLNPYDRKLEFSVHEATKLISVKVIDTNTDEVIREIPPEKILDMVAKLWEMAGIIVDKKI